MNTKFNLTSHSRLGNKIRSVLFAKRTSMTRCIRKLLFIHVFYGRQLVQYQTVKIQKKTPPVDVCSPLQQHLSQPEQIKLSFVKYKDIFGTLEKQIEAAEILIRLLEIWEEILQ